MPFDPANVPQPLLDAVRQRNLVPLVGAGVSRQASDNFPNWSGLLREMATNALTQRYVSDSELSQINSIIEKNQFLMAAETLRSKYPLDEYYGFLQTRFRTPPTGPAQVHEALFRLNPPLILTTNFDTLLEDAYASKFRRNAVVWIPSGAPEVANYLHTGTVPSPPGIFKLHGSIHERTSMILTEQDYRGLIYRQPGYRLVVSAIFVTKVVLMLGFSGDDPELRLLLEEMREALMHRSEPDYIFLPANALNTLEERRWREDFGLRIIPYEPTPGHPEVLEFVNYLTGFVP